MHNSKLTFNWFKTYAREPLESAAFSPDFNSIENLLEHLSQRLYKNGSQFETFNDLKEESENWCNSIDGTTLINSVNTLPERLKQVLCLNGGASGY